MTPVGTADEVEGGLDAQRLAEAVIAGKLPACGDIVYRQLVVSGLARFRCIRPIHEGPQPSVDQWRRGHGQSVGSDRHVYVLEPGT